MSLLYKFIASPDALQFILDGAVKFTPIPELNDPSELVPSMDRDAVLDSLDRLRTEGYSDRDMAHLHQQGHLLQTLAPRFQAVRVPMTKSEASPLVRSSFYDSVSTLERLLNETAQEMSSKVGLLCLSKRFDSLPMWAHYASNAAGLAVEFKDLEQVFAGDRTGVLRHPTSINYQRESYGVTFDPQSHRSLFFAKFQDWRYEQEVRVVLPLGECQGREIAGKQLYTYDIPKALHRATNPRVEFRPRTHAGHREASASDESKRRNQPSALQSRKGKPCSVIPSRHCLPAKKSRPGTLHHTNCRYLQPTSQRLAVPPTTPPTTSAALPHRVAARPTAARCEPRHAPPAWRRRRRPCAAGLRSIALRAPAR